MHKLPEIAQGCLFVLWAVENGYRLRVTDEETGRSRKASRTRGVTGISENSKLNRALWTLAEEFAKLKGRS